MTQKVTRKMFMERMNAAASELRRIEREHATDKGE